MQWQAIERLLRDVEGRANLPALIGDVLNRVDQGPVTGLAAVVASRFLEPERGGVTLGDVIDLIQLGLAPDDFDAISTAFADNVPAVVAAQTMRRKGSTTAVVLFASGLRLIDGERLQTVAQGLEQLFVEALLPPALEQHALPRELTISPLSRGMLQGAFGIAVASAASLAICYACGGYPVHTYFSARPLTQCSFPATYQHMNPKVTAVATTRC